MTEGLIQNQFMQIKVTLIASDLRRIYRAINKVNNCVKRESRDLPFRCAVDFRNLIILNINSQKHMGQYAPYNERYADWKKKTTGGSNFWILFGHLVNNLSVFPVGSKNAWMSGIPLGVKDQGGTSMFGGKGRSMLISVYGRWMEFGRRGQPARALFAPTTEEYAQGGWKNRNEESAFFIRKSWS